MEDEHNLSYCCRYCKYGLFIPLKRETLCEYAGVVDAGYVCKKYVFDPFKLKVRRARNMDFSRYRAEDFEIE